MNPTTIGLIVIPLVIFILGATYGGVRGAIRFAQYLVRTEESQRASANSVEEIATLLKEYMHKTDSELREQSERLTVVEFALLGKQPRSVRGIARDEP